MKKSCSLSLKTSLDCKREELFNDYGYDFEKAKLDDLIKKNITRKPLNQINENFIKGFK